MRRIILLILIITTLAAPVAGLEFSAPDAPNEAKTYLLETSGAFWQDVWYIAKKAISILNPSISEAAGICVSVLVLVMLVSLLNGFSGLSTRTVELTGTIAISALLLSPSNALIRMGIQTVESISEYGKLLLPVMTAALAAEGGTITSTALYTGTVLFNSLLTTGICKILIPILYAFLAISIAKSAIDEQVLTNLQSFLKWLVTWTLKIAIYLFTGYLTITGVVSGSADASAVKAAKLAISGSVPVVGSIISDASEAILVSAGVMKNAVGSYGLLAILATWIGPFMQIGIQYLTLKITVAVSGIFGCKRIVGLIDSFCVAMGFVVAMTGTICLLLLISTVCFMKGVG